MNTEVKDIELIPLARQYNDQRWINRALEKKDDQFEKFRRSFCQNCQVDKKKHELEVHHINYPPNVEREHIWTVPDEWLMVVCRDCHEKLKANKRLTNKYWSTPAGVAAQDYLNSQEGLPLMPRVWDLLLFARKRTVYPKHFEEAIGKAIEYLAENCPEKQTQTQASMF